MNLSWIKKIMINTLVLFISTFLFLLLSELVIRQFIPVVKYGFPVDYFVKDDVLGFDIKKNVTNKVHTGTKDEFSYALWSNSLGCFDNKYNHEDQYILLVGDSFTWGYAQFENKWGTLIENNLNQRVLKCGVSGFTTKGELIKAQRVIEQTKKRPSLIIVGYYLGNDIMDSYLFPNKTVERGYLINRKTLSDINGNIKIKSEKSIIKELKGKLEGFTSKRIEYWMSSNSILYQLYKKASKQVDFRQSKFWKKRQYINRNLIFSLSDDEWIRMAWKKHMDNILEFKNYAKSVNSEILFVMIPAKYQVDDSIALPFDRKHIKNPYKKLIPFFKEHDIDYLDLLPKFKEAIEKDKHLQLYYKVDGHWNESGNKLAGKIVTDYYNQKYLH